MYPHLLYITDRPASRPHKLTRGMVKRHVIHPDNWPDLFTNRARENLVSLIRRYLSDHGWHEVCIAGSPNVERFVDDTLLDSCRKKYRA